MEALRGGGGEGEGGALVRGWGVLNEGKEDPKIILLDKVQAISTTFRDCQLKCRVWGKLCALCARHVVVALDCVE